MHGIQETATQESFVRRANASKLEFRTTPFSDEEAILSDGSAHLATLVDNIWPEGKTINVLSV